MIFQISNFQTRGISGTGGYSGQSGYVSVFFSFFSFFSLWMFVTPLKMSCALLQSLRRGDSGTPCSKFEAGAGHHRVAGADVAKRSSGPQCMFAARRPSEI
jgi:hypothetical protein